MPAPTPRVCTVGGPQSALEQLLQEVETIFRDREAVLARPLRIVVASGAQRRELLARMTAGARGAALGLQVTTPWALARQLLEAGGTELPPLADRIFGLYAARAAAEQSELSAALDRWPNGRRLATPAIRDLITAGLTTTLVSEANQRLGRLGNAPAVKRAQAVVRAAARTHELLQAVGAQRVSDLLLQASQRLVALGPTALPTTRLFIFGFADAAGPLARWLAVLAQTLPTTVIVDLPADPADRSKEDTGGRFARRFAQLFGPESSWESAPEAPITPRISFVNCPGVDAEVREIAMRVRQRLDSGVPPERIGVVARSVDRYAAAWRTQAERFGLPFSGSEAPAGWNSLERRSCSLFSLIDRGVETLVDEWIDAGLAAPAEDEADVRLVLRTLGVARLRDVAQLQPGTFGTVDGDLPLRTARWSQASAAQDADAAVIDGADFDEESTTGESRRSFSRRNLLALVRTAQVAWQQLERWPQAAPFARHATALRQIAANAPDALTELLGKVLDRLQRLPLGALLLTRTEFRGLLTAEIEATLRSPLGGNGGGVRFYDAAHARGLTFDHLFLLGMNQGHFPRSIGEELLLDDRARQALLPLLPALALHQWGHDEERWLFASLCAAAPHVTLSWPRAGDNGKECAASAFVERLQLGESGSIVAVVPRLKSTALAGAACRTVREQLLLDALQRQHTRFEQQLPWALVDGAGCAHSALDAATGRQVAQARARVLSEQEPSRAQLAQIGPYHGLIGAVRDRRDPRHQPLYVTTLEQMARCGWQWLLTRLLRLEPTSDPLLDLPTIDRRLVGEAVHRALQRLLEPNPAARGGMTSAPVARPGSAQIEAVVRSAADQVAREAGVRLNGLVDVLVQQALVLVRRAVEVDWVDAEPLRLIATERVGQVAISNLDGDPTMLAFRADRIDEHEQRWRLTDYKTSRSIAPGKQPATRARKLRAAVASGRALQAAAYAASDPRALGRYLYLEGEDETSPPQELALAHEDEVTQSVFPQTVQLLLSAYQRGIVPPRLSDAQGKTPATCSYCAVRTACAQGDSGSRNRQRLALESLAASNANAASSWQRLFCALFGLGNVQLPPAEEAP